MLVALPCGEVSEGFGGDVDEGSVQQITSFALGGG